ncbi:unnamed protein product [Fraxinus pennsylvanica]|uniref:Rab3GAP catalytic subunit conserved domain-containing protein n=1 Tax=Fraxinus pennsylvanica TaxID=56036 RepID=A0AAD1YVN1_9LAMI|nr:unnamed protein product [Fraxinus pennsylvanica]
MVQSCQEVTDLRSRPAPIKTKQDWHERLRNIRIGKKGAEDSEKTENSIVYAIFDENLYFMSEREISESEAANPGCILEDFVRWHSPPDWMENDTNTEVNITSAGVDLLSAKGQLSTRMQKEGNPFKWLCFQELLVMKLNL